MYCSIQVENSYSVHPGWTCYSESDLLFHSQSAPWVPQKGSHMFHLSSFSFSFSFSVSQGWADSESVVDVLFLLLPLSNHWLCSVWTFLHHLNSNSHSKWSSHVSNKWCNLFPKIAKTAARAMATLGCIHTKSTPIFQVSDWLVSENHHIA